MTLLREWARRFIRNPLHHEYLAVYAARFMRMAAGDGSFSRWTAVPVTTREQARGIQSAQACWLDADGFGRDRGHASA